MSDLVQLKWHRASQGMILRYRSLQTDSSWGEWQDVTLCSTNVIPSVKMSAVIDVVNIDESLRNGEEIVAETILAPSLEDV